MYYVCFFWGIVYIYICFIITRDISNGYRLEDQVGGGSFWGGGGREKQWYQAEGGGCDRGG